MAFNPFDVSTKELVWDDPADWVDQFGAGAPGPVEVIDSDITALTAAADKVLRVRGANPYLLNIELHSYHDAQLAHALVSPGRPRLSPQLAGAYRAGVVVQRGQFPKPDRYL